MEKDRQNNKISDDVAAIMLSLAAVLSDMHRRDVAFQKVMGTLIRNSNGSLDQLHDLQHIDLLAQVHQDLSNLFPALARSLTDDIDADLAACLTLHSLRDSLLGQSDAPGNETTSSGDLTLF